MLEVLRHRRFRRLFTAQVVALIGTGLLTVALGLLAYDLAGADAGAVLGTALAIKMVAYVVVAPIVSALTDRLPRRVLLVSADAVRAVIALTLPFVSDVWQANTWPKLRFTGMVETRREGRRIVYRIRDGHADVAGFSGISQIDPS